MGVPLLPRTLSMVSRTWTGIEIHPAATIGQGFFIDHGAGVVIGETAEIGNDVTLYQGVTLGGTGFQTGKRHPTLEDNVTVGAGAKLLGAITVGHGAKIGANSVVIHDVPPNTTVVGNPGHPVRVEGKRVEGPDTDWIHLPDPIADAITRLSMRIAELEAEVAQLSGSERERVAEVRPLRPAQGRAPPAAEAGRGRGGGGWERRGGDLSSRPCASGGAGAPCTPAPARGSTASCRARARWRRRAPR